MCKQISLSFETYYKQKQSQPLQLASGLINHIVCVLSSVNVMCIFPSLYFVHSGKNALLIIIIMAKVKNTQHAHA